MFVIKIDNVGNFVWAKQFGGATSNFVTSESITLDAAGNIYLAGDFNGTVDFDPGIGVFAFTGNDMFTCKLDPSGGLIWAKQFIINTPFKKNEAVAVDPTGNVYFTGYFGSSVDFDPGPGIFNLTPVSGADIFICKLDNAGNFVDVYHLTGTFAKSTYDIVSDGSGNIFVTGYHFGTTDFDPGPGTYNLSSNGLVDIFIQKIDSSGNLVWVYSFGSSGGDSGNSITIDNQGDIYITGTFRGTIDFNPGIGISNLTVPPTSSWGIFILKLDANGNFIWAKSIDDGSGNSIEVDSFNNVYITGGFGGGTIDFDPGPGVYNLTSTTINRDVFVLKLTSNGDFIWAVGYGSSANEAGLDIHIDNAYNVYISGYFKTGTVVDFNPGIGIYNLISNGNDDAFIQKLDSSGVFIWAKSFGGTGYEIVKDVVTDNNGNVYAIGQFDWTVDFDPSPGVFNLISLGGNADNFVVKLDVNGNFVWANSTGGLNVDITTDIEIDDFGDLYISG